MTYLIMIFAIVSFRFFLSKIKRGRTYELLRYIGGATPLVLLITEVIHKDALTIIIAGFCMFYFAIFSGRPDNKDTKSL
jgi:hypothetical protein